MLSVQRTKQVWRWCSIPAKSMISGLQTKRAQTLEQAREREISSPLSLSSRRGWLGCTVHSDCSVSAPPIPSRLPQRFRKTATRRSVSCISMAAWVAGLRERKPTWKISIRMTLSGWPRFTLCLSSIRFATFLMTSTDLRALWLRMLWRIAYCGW